MRHAALATAVTLALPSFAAAQEEDHAETSAIAGVSAGSPRSQVNNWLVMPDDSTELGGEVAFVTAKTGPGGRELLFTDVGLLRMHARYGFSGAEVVFGGSFLMKQPSYTDESPWQSASVAGRLGLGNRWAASLSLAGGPTLGDEGLWGAGSARLEAKTAIHETVAFSGSVDLTGTRLRGEDEPWLAEVGLRGSTLYRAGTFFGMWIGVDLDIPVAHEADVMPIDPQVRLGFHTGMVYAVVDDWDFYMDLAILDRGDADVPATTLPILDGGFDQQQIVFGIIRRFAAPEDTLYMSL
jgi:hypothetical protein